MQKDQLKRKTKLIETPRVGRGGKRGKTAGRGHKGQKARAGHRIRPEIRDMIKKLPKLRGRGVNLNTSVKRPVRTINIEVLDANFAAKDVINPTILLEKGIIRRVDGRAPGVKILSVGETTKAFVIEKCDFSVPAREKLEKAGATLK